MDNCKIIFVNAVPNMHPVDICVQGECIIQNLDFSNVSEFLTGISGDYLIEVYLSGYIHNKDHKILSEKINLSNNKIYSYSIIGTNNFVESHLIYININNLSEANVVFVNYSPYETTFNISVQNEIRGSKYYDIKYKERSELIQLNPDNYFVYAKEYATNQTLEMETFNINVGEVIIFYFVGFLTYDPKITCVYANCFINELISTY